MVYVTPNNNSCVYCGGGRVYEECLGNPVSVNYVGNQPNRAYNPYSNTFNHGWINHPNFSSGGKKNMKTTKSNPSA